MPAHARAALPPDLITLLKRQRGHCTRAQALDTGLSAGQLRGRLQRGDLVVFHPRVYRLAGLPESWEADVTACLLAAGDDAVVSHGSAARLLGLERVRSAARIELTVPYGTRTKPGRAWPFPVTSALRVHRTRQWEPSDTVHIAGLPVTRAARTLIDVAGRQPRHQTLALVDDAIGARLVSRGALFERARALRQGRPGVASIVDVTRPGAEGTFRSWLERHAGRLLRSGRIRGAQWNVAVNDGSARTAVLDILFPAARLPVELDGPRFHEAGRQRRADGQRGNLLHRLDLHPLRYTYGDLVEEPERFLAEISAALRARGCAHLLSP